MNAENNNRIVNQFCKFCTRLLKNEANDVYREQTRGQKYKNKITISPLEDVKQVGIYDDYFKDRKFFIFDDTVIVIANDELARAIHKLPKNKRDVILFSYFLGMSDVAIGKRLNLIQQTVFKRRKSALKLLQKILVEEDITL